jgi:hypothetical protein
MNTEVQTASLDLGNQRLLELARILDTADELHQVKGEPLYTQEFYMHTCGSPACALGHWAYHNQDRWGFFATGSLPRLKGLEDSTSMQSAQMEFDLCPEEARELFEIEGCGYAKTAAEAAAYIRQFVENRA